MKKQTTYINMVMLIMSDLLEEAKTLREQQIADAKAEADIFDEEVIEEDINLAYEEFMMNVDEIKESGKQLINLINTYI